MSISQTSLETVDFNGYFSIWIYVHYFVPGRLKLHTSMYEAEVRDLKNDIEKAVYEPWLYKGSRRWLQKGEMPFPGYCRSPGSEKCLPVLCNCKKLKEIWNMMKNRLSHRSFGLI